MVLFTGNALEVEVPPGMVWHLIHCENLSENEVTENLPNYDDIFSNNVYQLAKIGRLIKAKHEKLKQVIKLNQANAPSMSAAVSSTVSNNCNNDCIGT